MKALNKVQFACDVSVYSDKGSLALRFPKRHTPLWELLDGKSLKGKPKCLGIGKYGYSDNPEDWKRASQLAIALEADLDHPEWEKLFDPTLAKYGLGGGKYAKLADVLQMPGTEQAEPEMTVGQMWEKYLVWKETVVEETTFKQTYVTTFGNAIKGQAWNRKNKKHETSGIDMTPLSLTEVSLITNCLSQLKISKKNNLVQSLKEAYEYCKSNGMVRGLTENPFADKGKYTVHRTTQDKYASTIVDGEYKEWYEIRDEKLLEEDRRAFTKEERDIIIKAFYDAPKTHAFYAPLIEFYFLTGCRTSEAIALTWKDIDLSRGVIRFSKSFGTSTQKVKETKTGETRLFYFGNDSRVKSLLLGMKIESSLIDNKLVFPSKRGGHLSISTLQQAWKGYVNKQTLRDGTEKEYCYPGVVTRLASDGKLSGNYLPQYHTRHTYITLAARANAHNNNALLHIATSCGSSVDVILRHYLGVSEAAQIVEW